MTAEDTDSCCYGGSCCQLVPCLHSVQGYVVDRWPSHLALPPLTSSPRPTSYPCCCPAPTYSSSSRAWPLIPAPTCTPGTLPSSWSYATTGEGICSSSCPAADISPPARIATARLAGYHHQHAVGAGPGGHTIAEDRDRVDQVDLQAERQPATNLAHCPAQASTCPPPLLLLLVVADISDEAERTVLRPALCSLQLSLTAALHNQPSPGSSLSCKSW